MHINPTSDIWNTILAAIKSIVGKGTTCREDKLNTKVHAIMQQQHNT